MADIPAACVRSTWRDIHMTTLAERLLRSGESDVVDAQSQSSLFKLPPEVRRVIWSAALEAQDDPQRPYQYNSHHSRPRYRFHQKIVTDLLQTCRAIYLEAHDLPLAVNEVTLWCYRGPDGDPAEARNKKSDPSVNIEEDDTAWHFERFRRNPTIPIHHIREVHLFTQQYWLECDSFYFMSVSKELANVEKLTITLRRSDFWNWEQLRPIGIDPRWLAGVTDHRMKEIWAKDRAGNPLKTHLEAWGSHIRNLSRLRELVIEMETEVSFKDDMQEIVNHARAYWTFPHYSGEEMQHRGDITVEEWTGPPCMAIRRRSFQRVSEKPRLVKFGIPFRLSH